MDLVKIFDVAILLLTFPFSKQKKKKKLAPVKLQNGIESNSLASIADSLYTLRGDDPLAWDLA